MEIPYNNINEVCAILPNYNDLAFIRIHLDENDISFF